MTTTSERDLPLRVRMALYAAAGAFGISAWWATSMIVMRGEALLVPAPHQVPAVYQGTPLRLAMLHDLFTDRGERVSTQWHEARLRARLALIANGDPAAALVRDAYDDAAASLDRLGRYAEGEALLRRKLAVLARPLPDQAAIDAALARIFADNPVTRYEAFDVQLSDQDRDAYRCYANLGTLIVHAVVADSQADDAQQRLEEARYWIGCALALHPGAHFGREAWQWVAMEGLAARLRDPTLIERFDLLGRRLDPDVDVPQGSLIRKPPRFAMAGLRTGADWKPERARTLDPGPRMFVRESITTIAADPQWIEQTQSVFRHPVPFDEPAMGLVGMWWYGGGANPHLALALAGICEDIGQHRLAWEGYERSRIDFSERAQLVLAAYAAARQRRLEAVIATPREALRAAFQEDLAAGRAYVAVQHAREIQALAEGASIDDPAWQDYGVIATTPGAEEWLSARTQPRERVQSLSALIAGLLTTALCAAILQAVVLARLRRAKAAPLAGD